MCVCVCIGVQIWVKPLTSAAEEEENRRWFVEDEEERKCAKRPLCLRGGDERSFRVSLKYKEYADQITTWSYPSSVPDNESRCYFPMTRAH